MKAALFTLFAPGYVQDTIVPRLRARGIHVTRTLEPRDAAKTRITEDLVLFMHEFGPHANDKIVREAAKAHGKKFQYLTRKAGSWTDECPGRDLSDMPTDSTQTEEATILPAERLDAALRALVTLREVGQGYDVIAPQLGQFWRAGETAPRDGRALRRLIETVRERGEPKWFAAWSPSKLVQGPSSGNYAPPDVAPDEDDAELLKMFEQDNERLHGELTFERELVASLRKELADALDGGKTWKGEYDKLHERHGELKDIHAKDIDELRERILVVDRARQTAESEAEERRSAVNSYRLEGDGLRDRISTMNIAHQERTSDLAHARTRISELETTVSVAALERRTPETSTNGLGKMLLQINCLVPSILSSDEALERLVAYVVKQEGG